MSHREERAEGQGMERTFMKALQDIGIREQDFRSYFHSKAFYSSQHCFLVLCLFLFCFVFTFVFPIAILMPIHKSLVIAK